MAKIVLITFRGEGHVKPMLGIMKEWADRGDEVHSVETVHYAQQIKRLGAHVIKHPDYIRTLRVDEGNLDSMQPCFHAMLQ
ncbi:glycosyltransferase family 1 protein, partial [Bacillus pumilus]